MRKKTLLIIIITIIVLLVLAGGVFAYLFLATDVFKSDKELFAKYMASMADEKNGFVPISIEEYENKKENTAYENNGSFSVNTQILSDTTTDTSLQMISGAINLANSTYISFNGKVDNANKKVEENIQINYSDTVNMPFTYRQDGDKYGIQADSILPSYIVAVENNNLAMLLQNLGAVDVSNIPNKIEATQLQTLKLTKEEKNHILTNYIKPIYENMPEESFSKVKNSDGSIAYVYTTTTTELKNMLVQILETFNNDTVMINKVNSIWQEIQEVSNINDNSKLEVGSLNSVISNLKEQSVDEKQVQISLTQKDNDLNKISITSEDINIEILKEQTESNINYEFKVNDEQGNNGSIKIGYEGINTNSVTEKYDINFVASEMINVKYTLKNKVTFNNQISIDSMGTNTILLNNYNKEQLQPFVMQLGNKIAEVNSNQMDQIGYQKEFINPMAMWFTAPTMLGLYNNISSTINDNNDSLKEEEIKVNNEQYEAFKGVISGSQAKALCDKVKINNMSGISQQINVKFGEQASSTAFIMNTNDIETIKNNIQPAKTYNITLSYDISTGYVCEIGITEIN